MLANGAKLEYKNASQYVLLTGLKTLSEVGIATEKVSNTDLSDSVMVYEVGVGDSQEFSYTFKYENSSTNSSYRVLRKLQETGNVVEFRETLKDGTTTTFSGYPSVMRSGGGLNDPIEFTLSIALTSTPEVTDPSAS